MSVDFWLNKAEKSLGTLFCNTEDRQTQDEKKSKTEKTSASYSSGLY